MTHSFPTKNSVPEKKKSILEVNEETQLSIGCLNYSVQIK